MFICLHLLTIVEILQIFDLFNSLNIKEDCFIYIIVSCKLLKIYAAPMGTDGKLLYT